jgi:breast cancer 2 susceptibility protein
MEAGWLARHTRKQIDLSRESMGDEIEQELQVNQCHLLSQVQIQKTFLSILQTSCPPREVRSFRILVVQDARTIRRPANRTALVTVWNVLQLTLTEGSSAGSFEYGQRFLVGSLIQVDRWQLLTTCFFWVEES